MGEGTDGDLVDAGGRDGGDGVEVHAAAGFEENVLFAAYFDGCTELFVRHVVEKDEVDVAEAAEEADLIEGIGFDFDENVRGAFFGLVDGALESGGVAGDGEVVVLGQHAVEEAEAVVGAAAGADGEAFEFAESGGGFAGVEDEGFGAVHRVNKAAGEGGDAAEALEEVERGAFGRKEGAGRTVGGEDEGAGGELVAVVFLEGDFDGGIDLAEDLRGGGGAGEGGGFLGDEADGGTMLRGDKALGGDVAGAEVFSEGSPDGFAGGRGHGSDRSAPGTAPLHGIGLEQVALPGEEAAAVLLGDGHQGEARGDE